MEDKEIIECCIRKEQKFQKALYDKYSALLFGICRKNSRNIQDAEDMFQEAFIKLYSSLEKYSFQGSFEGWLRKFFLYFSWNWYRGKNAVKDEREITDISDAFGLTTHNNVFDTFTDEELLRALQMLQDKERIIFTMTEIEGIDIEEVSKQTGLQVVTIQSMNSRTKKKLKNYFINMQN